MEAVAFFPQGLGDVPGDGLPFPVGVGPEVDILDPGRGLLEFLMTLALPRMVTYLGRNSSPSSTPNSFLGRSLTWPLVETHLIFRRPGIFAGFWPWWEIPL